MADISLTNHLYFGLPFFDCNGFCFHKNRLLEVKKLNKNLAVLKTV